MLTLGDAHQIAQLDHSTLKSTVNNPHLCSLNHPLRSMNRPPCIPKHLRKVCTMKDRDHNAYLLDNHIHTYNMKTVTCKPHEMCNESKLLFKDYLYHPQGDKERYPIQETRTKCYFLKKGMLGEHGRALRN